MFRGNGLGLASVQFGTELVFRFGRISGLSLLPRLEIRDAMAWSCLLGVFCLCTVGAGIALSDFVASIGVSRACRVLGVPTATNIEAILWNSPPTRVFSLAILAKSSVNDFWLSLMILLSSSRSIDCHNIEKPALRRMSCLLTGKV